MVWEHPRPCWSFARDWQRVRCLDYAGGRYAEAIWGVYLGQDTLRLRNAYTLTYVLDVGELFDRIRILCGQRMNMRVTSSIFDNIRRMLNNLEQKERGL